jgi:hypothetical protein
MAKRIRVAASPARVAAQTGPIPAGKHLADRMPMPWAAEPRTTRRAPIVAGLAVLLPIAALVVGALSGAFGG